MAEKTKKWLIVATVLVILGAIIFGGAMMTLGWDFSKLSTVKYNTAVHTFLDEIKHISIDTDTADITFVPTADGNTKVVCYEREKENHIVSLVGDTLTIELRDGRRWYEHIGIGFETPKITVYLPQEVYGALTVETKTGSVTVPKDFSFEKMDIRGSTGSVNIAASASGAVKVKTSTGDITVNNISAGSMELSVSTGRITATGVDCKGDITTNVSTGKVSLTDVKCENLSSEGDTGSLTLKNVIANQAFTIERSTGDVNFDRCDAAQITVETDTGHIQGSLLSEKVFIARTDTGRVDVPDTTSGGKCQLTTDTGNIKIQLAK